MSSEEKKGEKGVFRELYETFFSHSWQMWLGSILLAVMSIFLFLIASPWGSSGGIVNWGQNLYHNLGLSLENSAPNGVALITEYRYAMLSITVIIGALVSALMGKEFAIRVAPAGELFKGLIGGLMMGAGCILAMGCTVGNFFSGLAALSAGAIIFGIGLFIGVFLSVKYLLWEMDKHPKMSSGKSASILQAKSKGLSLQPLAGLIIFIIGLVIVFTVSDIIILSFALIGLFIGILLQRSRWCVVRALREPFMTGDSEPAVGIIAGIIIGLLGFSIIKFFGIGSETAMVVENFWMPSIIGGIIFGFGMTIAGGCTIGSSWRAGEGHVKLWLALLGIIIAGPLTAEYIKPAFMNMLPGWMKQSIFLPDYFTYIGGVIIMILLLLMWYIFVKWNERTGKFTAL